MAFTVCTICHVCQDLVGQQQDWHVILDLSINHYNLQPVDSGKVSNKQAYVLAGQEHVSCPSKVLVDWTRCHLIPPLLHELHCCAQSTQRIDCCIHAVRISTGALSEFSGSSVMREPSLIEALHNDAAAGRLGRCTHRD